MAVKSRDIKHMLRDIKKGNLPFEKLMLVFKYNFNEQQRKNLQKKLTLKSQNKLFSNPLPKSIEDFTDLKAPLANDRDLQDELKWLIDVIEQHFDQIKSFLPYEQSIEDAILKGEYQNCYDLLNKLDEDVCQSFYAHQIEIHLNSCVNSNELSKEMLNELTKVKANQKLIVSLEYEFFKSKLSTSVYQFESFLEQEKKRYINSNEPYVADYLDFKFAPLRAAESVKDYKFIAYMDSDFSIIDRYITLRNLIARLLNEKELPEELKNFINEQIQYLYQNTNDILWLKMKSTLVDFDRLETDKLINDKVLEIQDLYIDGEFNAFISECIDYFKENPSKTQLYLFFSKAIINSDVTLDSLGLNKDGVLYKIIDLFIRTLSKTSDYEKDRDDLLRLYYSTSHYKFSAHIIEFLFNEYLMERSDVVKFFGFIHSDTLRYNSSEILGIEKIEQFSERYDYESFKLVTSIKEKLKQPTKLGVKNFFIERIIVGHLYEEGEFDKALLRVELLISDKTLPLYALTWLTRMLIKIYNKQRAFHLATDVIVDSFFKFEKAYDHFNDENLVAVIEELDDDPISRYLSVPIYLEVYKQSQTIVYDAIANFLCQYELERPSEIFGFQKKFPLSKFIYFLWKVCTRFHIEDSPFLITREDVDNERIKILIQLTKIDSKKTKIYNEEIKSISREATVIKGAQQIHGSKIFIDTVSIKNLLLANRNEFFDQYLEFNDPMYLTMGNYQLGGESIAEKRTVFYYNVLS